MHLDVEATLYSWRKNARMQGNATPSISDFEPFKRKRKNQNRPRHRFDDEA